MKPIIVETSLTGKPISLETGRMAKQADGSVIVRSGDSMVLVTVVSAKKPREGVDFLPLTVDYLERTAAGGRIPGGYFRREGKQTDKEVLTSRLIDRPLRPLFPEGYNFETQIVAQVISADPNVNPDVLAITGASAALAISDVAFLNLIGGVRVGRVDGKLLANPSNEEMEKADLEILVAGTNEAIVMVEGGALEASEEDMVEALDFAHRQIRELITLQKSLQAKVSKTKRTFVPAGLPEEVTKKVRDAAAKKMSQTFAIKDKLERNNSMKVLGDEIVEQLTASISDESEKEKAARHYHTAFHDLQYGILREMAVKEKRRIDNRRFDEIRNITCEVGVLPRTHGSALFTRGETQALVTVTYGTREDEQRMETLGGTVFKRFLLHYNFPAYSVGETKPLRGPGRREVGHGKLAERAVEKVLPMTAEYPYTVRIVSDILESNGSSSMATVCGSSLALMDAGCPIKSHVAGIAMGLIKEGDDIAILSDILGDEDHLGDMDFKVCGTAKGITSIQMDIKIAGVTRQIMSQALEQARKGRLQILETMTQAIRTPRAEISPYAPRMTVIQIRPERIKDVIGSGGKIIKGIIEQTGVKIDIDDTGRVNIFSADPAAVEEAVAIVRGLTADPEIGMIYKGKVKKITDFGAFVEILPGTEGLLHISQLHTERVQSVQDIVREGEEVVVKVLEVDRTGKIRLSRKEALGLEVGSVHPVQAMPMSSEDRGPRGPRR